MGDALHYRGQMLTFRPSTDTLDVLAEAIDRMAEAGLNLFALQVGSGVRYDSHPKASAEGAMDKKTLRGLVERARGNGLQCVPFAPPAKRACPEIGEGEGRMGGLCPRHPRTYEVLFDLAEETLEVFEPEWFHIGLDELLSSFRREERRSILRCERCRGDDAAKWLLEHIHHWRDWLGARGVVPMMWADMLMAPDDFRHTASQHNSVNGGPPDHFERALDDLPRDIILCDWHYSPSREYPTLRYLQDKGFDVLGCPRYRESSYLFTRYAMRTRTPRLLGMMGTYWGRVNESTRDDLLQVISDNGFFFEGGDAPDLRQKCEAAEARRFGPGDFEHRVDFSAPQAGLCDGATGLCETAGWLVFQNVARSQGPNPKSGLALKSSRKGKIWVSFKALPGCVFEKFETELDFVRLGPGRIGVSVDGGKSYAFREPVETIDWSDAVAEHGEALVLFEMTNSGPDQTMCLTSLAGRGRIVPRKAAGGGQRA